MNFEDTALMNTNCMKAEEEYFSARPQIDTRDRRLVFQAGFVRAWEAAISGRMCDGSLIPPKPFV